MARPRKPTQLKLVTGTLDTRYVNPKEPKPKIMLPPMPPGLSTRAKEGWNRAGPLLERMGVLTNMDAMALEQFCIVYGVLMDAKDRLEDLSDFSYDATSPNGGETRRPHPEVAVYFEALRQFRAMLNEFGMTPASRGKVAASPDKTREDPLEKYFG